MLDFGFIIVRHVNSVATNEYWKHAVRCVRQFYPDTPIVIVCDNSSREFLTTDSSDPFENLRVVVSEFPGKGEILGYYYLHKLQLFKKALVLHDSTFICRHYDYAAVADPCRFLYHFPGGFHEYDSLRAMGHFHQCDPLIDFYNKKDQIVGCFGCQALVDWDFLDRLDREYHFFAILHYIRGRHERYNMERLFALVCIHALKYSYMSEIRDITTISLFGDITQEPRWGMPWETYQTHLEAENTLLDSRGEPAYVTKVFTGR
jgi:hypothetical protein